MTGTLIERHLREVSKAVTGLTIGAGSEFFVKVGNEFYVCPDAIRTRIGGMLEDGREARRKCVLQQRNLEHLQSRLSMLEKVAGALERIAPIRVHNGPDYAEVYFSDGKTHSTQAMTMNPDDWLALAQSLQSYREVVGRE